MLHLWEAGVWKWMLFLYNSGVDLNDTIANEGRPLPMTRQMITVGIVDALVGCANSVPLGKRLILVPDIVALIGRLWVEDLEIKGKPNMVHKELTFTMFHILNDDTNDSVLSTLIDTVDGGAKTIMQAATHYLRQLASSTPVDASSIDTQVSFIDSLAKHPVFEDGMHEVETLSVALLAVDALTKQARGSDSEAVEGCISAIILPHLLSGTSVKPLIHAINKGLLRSLYDARIAFPHDKECCEAIGDVVIQVVGPSLAFRSVLHAVERSENKTGFLATYRAAGFELHEWETLHEVYQEMLQFRCELDKALKPCGRGACPTNLVDTPIKLQRCRRCESKSYCSKECQREDWPEHKPYCYKESGREIYPVSDREFARELAEVELRKNIKTLCDRIEKNPALKPSKGNLTFQVDFSTLDRNIAIGVMPCRPGSERLAAIYAKVKSGREDLRSLGHVQSWDSLRTSAL
ncbi:hypothetical protein B0H11DRAFT_875732 [Mycena galericulata]|nr:hypothetical protein B0H11DRAFT_875732 [Mycena galericulata]